ncbi:C protein beta antigen [Streptomyces laurentii]|uniref:C protein beta antigen n=1 Tax=Streptomyces laurentii TaxID=39478 RepID=A0A160PAE7_STRLU|nr:C protein beta antigen [Streptomyces laurentii]
MTPHTLTCPHAATEAPPLLGEPLALEFANTHYAVRGSLRDGLGRPDHLAWWLWTCRDRFTTDLTDTALANVNEADVVHFRELRDASRRLIDARVQGWEPDSRDVAQLNRAGGLGRSWPILLWNPDTTPPPPAWAPKAPPRSPSRTRPRRRHPPHHPDNPLASCPPRLRPLLRTHPTPPRLVLPRLRQPRPRRPPLPPPPPHRLGPFFWVRLDQGAGSGAGDRKAEEGDNAVGAPPVPEGLRGSW